MAAPGGRASVWQIAARAQTSSLATGTAGDGGAPRDGAPMTPAQGLLLAASGVILVVHGVLARDVLRDRSPARNTAGELVLLLLPLAAVMTVMALALVRPGISLPR